MSAFNPYLTLTRPFNVVHAWTTQQLNKVGLQIEQTFDLHVARLSHVGCTCPRHGTEQCICQMVVLLVRGEGKDPLTLILQGNDGQTNLSIASLTGKLSNPSLDATIRLALIPQDIETI